MDVKLCAFGILLFFTAAAYTSDCPIFLNGAAPAVLHPSSNYHVYQRSTPNKQECANECRNYKHNNDPKVNAVTYHEGICYCSRITSTDVIITTGDQFQSCIIAPNQVIVQTDRIRPTKYRLPRRNRNFLIRRNYYNPLYKYATQYPYKYRNQYHSAYPYINKYGYPNTYQTAFPYNHQYYY